MATVTANKLALFVNPTLLELGKEALSTLGASSTDPMEKTAALTLNQYIVQCLRAVPWQTPVKGATLLPATGVSAQDFNYAYLLPTDFVSLAEPVLYSGYPLHYSQERDAFRIAGRYTTTGQKILLSKVSGVQIRYIYMDTFSNEGSDTDTYYKDFDEELIELIRARCAWGWAFVATGNAGLVQTNYQLYQDQRRKALAYLANQSPTSGIVSDRLTYKRNANA